MVSEEGEEAVEVEDKREEEVKALREVVEIVIKIKDKANLKAGRAKTLGSFIPGTRQPGIQTCHHFNPVLAIGFSGKLLISVKSLDPVHGKIIGYQRATTINEIQADSRK